MTQAGLPLWMVMDPLSSQKHWSLLSPNIQKSKKFPICLFLFFLSFLHSTIFSFFIYVFILFTGVPQSLQKVMYKGMAKNEQTLKSLGVTNKTKIMLVGSKLNDVLNLATVPSADEQKALQEEKVSKEPWSRQKMHRTVLDKGDFHFIDLQIYQEHP